MVRLLLLEIAGELRDGRAWLLLHGELLCTACFGVEKLGQPWNILELRNLLGVQRGPESRLELIKVSLGRRPLRALQERAVSRDLPNESSNACVHVLVVLSATCGVEGRCWLLDPALALGLLLAGVKGLHLYEYVSELLDVGDLTVVLLLRAIAVRLLNRLSLYRRELAHMVVRVLGSRGSGLRTRRRRTPGPLELILRWCLLVLAAELAALYALGLVLEALLESDVIDGLKTVESAAITACVTRPADVQEGLWLGLVRALRRTKAAPRLLGGPTVDWIGSLALGLPVVLAHQARQVRVCGRSCRHCTGAEVLRVERLLPAIVLWRLQLISGAILVLLLEGVLELLEMLLHVDLRGLGRLTLRCAAALLELALGEHGSFALWGFVFCWVGLLTGRVAFKRVLLWSWAGGLLFLLLALIAISGLVGAGNAALELAHE